MSCLNQLEAKLGAFVHTRSIQSLLNFHVVHNFFIRPLRSCTLVELQSTRSQLSYDIKISCLTQLGAKLSMKETNLVLELLPLGP